MRSRISLALALSTYVGVLVACDGNGGPVLTPDAGNTDSGPAPVDASEPEVDTERPRVTSTSPAQGSHGVAADATIAITFSEPMREDAGTVAARAGDAELATTASWSDDGQTLTLSPSAPLPSETRVEIALGDDFADRAGNTLALPFVLVFETGDFEPPVVVGSEPAQGATGLSARLDAITIRFDEQMYNAAGTLSLEGGAGTIGAPTWIDGRTLRAPVSGLAYGTTYRVVLAGFEDAAGNALDTGVYLDGGAIVLTTGADHDPPRIVDSMPSEGQVNVALRGTPAIVLVFDEPMDTSAGTATLHAGGVSTVLSAGTWSDGGRRLSLPVAGRLYPNAPHSVALEGFRDLAGNALDAVAYLSDGALDFDTGADATVPVVVFSYPNEGSTSSDHQLSTIEIAFDRAMDTGVDSLEVSDGTSAFTAPVTWNLAGTRAYADVSERIHAGRSYRVDLRGFVDVNGDPVDPAAPYLGDGVLDFSTRAPRGDQCRDELRITEATSRTATGGYEWVIPETSMITADNARACQYPQEDSGSYSTSYSPDAVLLYRKTTPSGSAGGRYLWVSVTSTGVGQRLSLAVYRNACGEAGGGAPEDRLTCQWDRYRWDQFLDVGEGDYYIWVASTGSSQQPEFRVTVEEVDAVPAGESCANPLRASASEPAYTAPTTPDGEHVWTVTGETYHAADMDDSWPGEGAISCDEYQVQGVDFVVEYQKTSPDTLLSVFVDATAAGAADNMHVEALSTCDPRDPSAVSYGAICRMRPQSAGVQRRMTLHAPAGPVYLWAASDYQRSGPLGARLRVREIPNAPGSSCENAIPIPASGTTPITADSLARLDVPSCMRDVAHLDGITWYRLTTEQVATVLRTDVAAQDGNAGLAVIDVATGREIACNTGAPRTPVLALLPVGSEVCVAVRNGSGIGAISLASQPYEGIRGVPTDLGITPPLTAAGNPVAITGARWIAATPTTLYAGLSSSVITAPRGGGAATQLSSSYLGYDGVSVGEALFTIRDTTTTTGTGLDRLYRLVDPSGAWMGTAAPAWDGSFPWVADSFRAMATDGTWLYVANDYAASVPTGIWRFSAATAGDPIYLGALGSDTRGVSALTLDETWFYWIGVAMFDGTAEGGVFRLRRDALGTGTPERIAVIPVSISSNAAGGLGSIVVDSLEAATHLYARGSDGHVHVVVDPGGASPVHLGAISTLGGNQAMTIDRSGPSPSLVVIDGTASPGRFVRLD